MGSFDELEEDVGDLTGRGEDDAESGSETEEPDPEPED